MLTDSQTQRSLDTMSSPLGGLWIIGSEQALIGLVFDEGLSNAVRQLLLNRRSSANTITEKVKRQLGEYFSGERQHFDLPLALEGTPFQRSAWQALLKIDFGNTISYSEQAKRIGRPQSHRAVANANGKNPVPIVVPCHRVIAKDGALGGYGPGLNKKQWLLQHESAF